MNIEFFFNCLKFGKIPVMELRKRDIARTKFKLEVYESKGKEFQDFFTRVMIKAYPDFQAVKPQGKIGDQKNDGFIPSEGVYYQVYAPETPSDKIITAIKKCKLDFQGLVTSWHHETPIKEFYFAFNDEYRGNYPELLHTVASMQTDNPSIKIGLFLPKDLEDVFLNLPEEKIQDVIGYIPESDGIEVVDYDILTNVVKHLYKNAKPVASNGNLKVPDFNKKIQFNKLSHEVAALLTTANFQASVLYDFFQNNSGFSRQVLRDIFSELYKNAQQEFAESIPNRTDLVFFSIIKKAQPNQSKWSEDAVLVLMSYFFESCDIFEEPK